MNGILLFNKPILWTSHDVVDFVRRKIGLRRVGHAGTLDPLATGLLVMLVGEATKRATEFSGLDKEYRGTLTLGIATDTQDLEGRILASTVSEGVSEEAISQVFRELSGAQQQKPPQYSAVKVKGRKLYDLARHGIVTEVESRGITVNKFATTAFDLPEVHFVLDCSKGTYVRVLCDEVGRRLGCGATLSSLVRTRVGKFKLENAVTAELFQKSSVEQIKQSLT